MYLSSVGCIADQIANIFASVCYTVAPVYNIPLNEFAVVQSERKIESGYNINVEGLLNVDIVRQIEWCRDIYNCIRDLKFG